MKKVEKEVQPARIVKGFELVNVLKVERAINAVGDSNEDALLAEYDRLGGLIRHNGSKVVTGSFFDFRAKKPIEDPKPKVIKRQAAVVEEEIEVVDEVTVPKKTTKKATAKKADEEGVDEVTVPKKTTKKATAKKADEEGVDAG